MSTVFKCILGLFIVMCLVQFIQMQDAQPDPNAAGAAPNAANGAPNADSGMPKLDSADLKKTFGAELNQIKQTLEADAIKNIMAAGTQQITGLLEKFQKAGENIKLRK